MTSRQLPEPVGFRTRRRHEPGAPWYYLWTYGRCSERPKNPEWESEDLFTADQVHELLAAERERCARICDETPPYPFRPAIEAAHAIRHQADK